MTPRIFLVLATGLACTPTGTGTTPTDPLTADQTLTAATVDGLAIADGVTVTVPGQQLVVAGDLTLGRGAALVGTDPDKLVVVVTGDVRLDGEVTSPGHTVLVSSEALVPSDAELDEEELEHGITLSPLTGTPQDAVWAIRAPIRAGRRGDKGASIHIAVDGDLSVEPAKGKASLTFEVPDGEDGEDLDGCSVRGGRGGRGGKLNVRVRGGTLVLRDVLFTGSNGGWGGDADGVACPDGSSIEGGEGGKSGTFRIVAQLAGSLDVRGSVAFDGWNAGHGGDAIISGVNGDPGASVTAEGGAGQDVDGYSLRVSGGIDYDDAPSLQFDIGDGGEAGFAQASGGNGLVGICDKYSGLATASGSAGAATAESGTPGDVDVTVDVPAGAPIVLDDAFVGGHAADADAYGGNGGDGVPCFLRGGDGGLGGDATPTVHDPGTSNQNDDGDDAVETGRGGLGGVGGSAEVEGGDGGNGGSATGDDPAGGDGGPGGNAYLEGGDGGSGGCPDGLGGAGGTGKTPGVPGLDCP